MPFLCQNSLHPHFMPISVFAAAAPTTKIPDTKLAASKIIAEKAEMMVASTEEALETMMTVTQISPKRIAMRVVLMRTIEKSRRQWSSATKLNFAFSEVSKYRRVI